MSKRRYRRIMKRKPLTVKTAFAKTQSNDSQTSETQEIESPKFPAQTAKSINPKEQEQQKPVIEEEQEGNTDSQDETSVSTVECHGDYRFPLVSSHLINGRVKTTAVLVSPHGTSLVHCNAMPKLTTSFGVERVAPYIAAIHRKMVRQIGKRETQRRVAEAFIIRARQGDQNAMGMIALVRDGAQANNPQALASFKFMQDYINKHPVTPSSFGEELCMCVKPDNCGAFDLANGPKLSNSRIRRIVTSFGNDERQIFMTGFRKWQIDHDAIHEKLAKRLDNIEREILKMGRTIGQAQGIQMLRSPNGKIGAYSAKAAWELGE